jgi:predicted heme/steroid binding protein
LVGGAFPPRHAKALGELIFKLKYAGGSPGVASVGVLVNGTFDVSAFGLWTDAEHDVCKMGMAMSTQLADALKHKMKGVDECMLKHSQPPHSWKGALSRLDVDLTGFDFGGALTLHDIRSPGNRPFLTTCARNVHRTGPPCFPMPGAGCFVVSVGEPVMLVCSKVDELLSNGIVLANVPKFFSSDAGAAMILSGTVVLIEVPAGAIAFVPWGFVADPLYFNNCAKNDKVAAKWAHCIHMGVFDVDLAKQISKEAFLAIHNSIQDHLSKETNQMWKDRAAFWADFAKLVTAA